jgi:diacylglycerol kinase family enzyme
MRRRFFLIFNARAGTLRTRAVDAVVAALSASGARVERSCATSAELARTEAAAAARSGDFDAVVAAGGDGTVRQVAAAAADTDCAVGAIMLGTGNVLAYELALPRRAAAIAALLSRGPTLEVSLGRANGEPFLLMAGAGFDGRVVAALNHDLKQRIAKAAYLPPVLQALTVPLDRLQVDCDGVRSEATWVIVTNARRYGGAFVLSEHTRLAEPGLVAVLFRSRSKLVLSSQLASLAVGRLTLRAGRNAGDVEMRPVDAVQITSHGPVPVQIDGDAFATTPLHVTRSDARVRLIVPG